VQRVPDGENPAPECSMWFDPQKALTKHDETRDMQNHIGIQIMELNPIRKEKAA
jgi:hypothetical protein